MILTKNPANPTDLKKFDVKIDGTDVSMAVGTAIVFQDLFLPTWTCQLLMNDMNNFIQNTPIRAGSKIEITVETQHESELDGSYTWKFVVSKISDKNFINYMHQTYTIHGVAKEFLKNHGKRVSQSYKNKKPTQIAQSIFKEYLGVNITEVDNCENTFNTIICNISPLTAAAQMTKSALKNGVADYILFQWDYEKYKFKSFEKLFTGEDSGLEFIMKPGNIRDDQGNLKYDYNLCINQYHIEHYDMSSAVTAGMTASRVTQFDMVSKCWKEKDFKFGDDVSEDAQKKNWEDDDLFEQAEQNIAFYPKHDALFCDADNIFSTVTSWAPSRKSSLQKMQKEKLIIQCPGGVMAWKSIGKTCKVKMPGHQDITDEKEEDKQMKGTYLIGAIAHFIDRRAYHINYELYKKRYEEKL